MQSQTIKDVFGRFEKKVKEEFDPTSVEVDAVGYLVVHLEGENFLDL